MAVAAFRPRFTPVMVAGIAVGLVLTGCGSGDDPAPAPTTESPAAIPDDGTGAAAWVDAFCGAINGFADDYNNLPKPTNGDTFEAIRESTSTQLREVIAVLDKAITALEELPEAPDTTAESAARTATDNYTTARETAVTAKTELDAAPVDDVEAQGRAVDSLIAAEKQAHRSLDPVAPLTGSPELLEAAATAPNCAG